MELRDLLDQEYQERLRHILRQIKELNPFINPRYYTDHGGEHTNRVERLINRLLPDDIKQTLNCVEAFLLLSAIHLHDIGMMEGREEHHEKSKKFVEVCRDYLGLDKYEASNIGYICWAHGVSKREIKITVDHLSGERVRKQFLIALLRLGDILDIEYHRAPEIVYNFWKNKMSPDSRVFWYEHQVFKSVYIDPQKWLILIEAQPSDEIINGEKLRYRVIETVFKIQEELDNWTGRGGEYGLLEREKLYYNEVLLRLESQGIFLPVRVWMEMLQREKMVSKMISLFKDRDRKKVIGFLKEIVRNQNEDQYVRGAAIEELKVLKAKEALPELIQLVNDKYPRIRKLALEAIADIAPYRNIEIIFKKSKDEEDRDIREVAQNLIRGLKRERRFVKFMLSILPKKEWSYTPRDLAIEKLKEFKEKRALKILKKIDRDETEDENLREATREVIKVLEEGNA